MHFPSPLVRGLLLRRYKRFLADVEVEGHGTLTVHCPNPGAMTGLTDAGTDAWLRDTDDPRRKLRWSLELLAEGETLVGVNTGRANSIVAEALAQGKVPPLKAYTKIRREVPLTGDDGERSRIDFALEGGTSPHCLVEVKSVTLTRAADGGSRAALFPDSVTRRGARHLRVLGQAVQRGMRAICLFLVQRSDCRTFAPAADIDPDYARDFTRARAAGVEMLCYDCHVTPRSILLNHSLPIVAPS